MTKKLFTLAAVAALLVSHARAAIRIDIDPEVDRKDILTKGAESWKVRAGSSASHKSGDITVSVRAIGDGATLGSDWWKGGYDYGCTFMTDGAFVRGGGAMELTVAGLSPGKHGIATFHNSIWDAPVTPFSISVNGEQKLSSVKPSQRVTNEYDAASAFVEVNAEAGKDVVILFKPEGSGKDASVILNGLAIDATDPAKQATKPSPAPGDEHAPANTVLSWTPARGPLAASRTNDAQPAAATIREAASGGALHRLFLGTNRDAVEAATPASPEFKGDLIESKFPTTGLNTFDTYYWRVDQIDASKNVTKGDVWSFRVQHLAFPGAEGYGQFAIGGRAGKVIEVTSLEDSGPGSLREAINTDGPRTIVFRVGGTIHLKSKLIVSKPYCTIAGQTAPGEGIATRGFTFAAGGTHDVIIRYMRVRIGDESGQTNDGCGLGGCDNSIVDHSSVAWSIDEGFSSRGAHNITLQRSIITEPLNMSIHSHYVGTGKGHSFAGSISGDIGTFHHNLLANCAGRNWSLAGGLTRGGKFAGRLDIRNNVVYNWAHRTNDGGVKALNLVGNYYIPGAASKVFHFLLAIEELKLAGDHQQYFVADNVMEGRTQYDADNWQAGGVRYEDGTLPAMKLDKPYCEPMMKTESAIDAYKSVVADVGANFPKLDSIDARAISDTVNRTTTFKGSKTGIPGIIDSQADVGEYADLKGGEAPADTDHDGMSDEWEKAQKLNPADASDGAKDSVGDGYTNLERYLNGMVAGKIKG